MKCNREVFGTVTVNEKGQIVIPADARKKFNIEPDMKLMIVGDSRRKVLVLVPASLIEKKMQGFLGRFFSVSEES